MVQGKKTVRKPKRITLQYLISNELPIWVINNTGKVGTSDPAIVTLQVGHGDDWDSIKIPPGRDPVCLTDWLDPISIRSCKDLFKLVRQRVLLVQDPEKAEEYYDENEERRKVMEDKLNKYMSSVPEEDDVFVPKAPEASSQVLNPKIDSICMRARHGAIKERDALERLMEQESAFKEADYEYLLKNGHFEGVKKWAKEKLNGLHA